MSTPEYPGPPETPSTEPTTPLPPTHHPYGAVPPQQPPGLPPQPPMPPAPGYYGGYAPAAPADGLAVASMVVGILGLLGLCGYGLGAIISPVALVLGRMSMKKIDASQGQLGGRGFAQAGFIMGVIGTILFVLALIAIAVFFGALFSTDCFGDGC